MSKKAEFYRDTWAEINLDALNHNYNEFVKHCDNQKMIAVIKANGYGHGDLVMAEVFTELGACYLGVSSLDEALKIRRANITTPIIVLAPVKISDVEVASKNNVTIIAYDEQWVLELSKLTLSSSLTVHFEVETGMNRVGLRDVEMAYEMLSQHEFVKIEGIYTHIASADSDLDSLADQLDAFHCILNNFEDGTFEYVHLANTPTAMQVKNDITNAVRVGIGLYGVNPDPNFIKTDFDLRPAFAFYSRLTQVSNIEANESVSYSGTFVAQEAMSVGTLSVGYGDGWCRLNQGRFVLINGYECEIIGRVCMDQMMVKLPHSEFAIGDKATLIGDRIEVNRVAQELSTIPYEVLTLISDRVPRLYFKNKQLIGTELGRFNTK